MRDRGSSFPFRINGSSFVHIVHFSSSSSVNETRTSVQLDCCMSKAITARGS
ncbi:hypothetical protein GLYMA_12G100466v4 [Glycine max]|nr:hypothetical protein GLYMA_12G100466v4 [Glycine max]KAH1142498.1 hypothetical protein GYH30_033267 [Glycine max]